MVRSETIFIAKAVYCLAAMVHSLASGDYNQAQIIQDCEQIGEGAEKIWRNNEQS